jgi:hypothetical protein
MLSAAATASELEDVRIGKHADKTRVVFQLSTLPGYQVELNNPAPGIAELVVAFDASGQVNLPTVPKGSLIEQFDLQTDGQRSVAHIRLAGDGLRHREITLREPPRLVIDIVKESVTPPTPPAPKPVAAVEPVAAPVVEEFVLEEVAVEEVVVDEEVAVEEVVVEKEVAVVEEVVVEEVAVSEVDPAAALPSDPTAPLSGSEPVVPIAASPRTSLPPATEPPVEASTESGWFTMRNLALAAAGVALVIFASFVLGRRSEEDEEFTLDEEDDLGGDNPFSGLESPVGAAATEPAVVAEVLEPAQDAPEQAEPFEVTEALPVELVDASEPETADEPGLAFDDTDASEEPGEPVVPELPDPEVVVPIGQPTAAHAQDEAGPQLVRELATRVAELETRLEDAVDSKDRLERQIAAQTEELRVQRAAIARTQRAVRNLTQVTEDKPTEPTPRVGG